MLYNKIVHILGTSEADLIESMPMAKRTIRALERALIRKTDGVIPVSTWMLRWDEPVAFNQFVYILSSNSILTADIEPRRRHGAIGLNWNSFFENEVDFNEWRIEQGSAELMLDNKWDRNDPAEKIGVSRPGFVKTSKYRFKYDTYFLELYQAQIVENMGRKMWEQAKEKGYDDFISDKANFIRKANQVVNNHIADYDAEFTLGGNRSEPRARANHTCTSKPFNPLTNKDARSLLISMEPQLVTSDNLEAIRYINLFIAELGSKKRPTEDGKALAGKMMYSRRETVDYTDTKNLHEHIWLQRIYAQLDEMYKNGSVMWNVPLEIDFTASMLAITGLLLGDYNYLDLTNVIYGEGLKDAWTIDGIPRLIVKTAVVPKLYASSASVIKLLDSNRKFTEERNYTPKQVRLLNTEIHNGRFALANMLKDFMVKNCNPEPEMMLHIDQEKVITKCNRHYIVGEEMHEYDCYDTVSDTIKTFFQMKTTKVPNLEASRRYFPTGLIHNLDSQIEDYIVDELNEWVLDNHDALLLLPTSIKRAKTLALEKMKRIKLRGHTILLNYFKSINIDMDNPVVWYEWTQILELIQEIPKYTRLSGACLK